MQTRDKLRCDEIAPNTFFLGWDAIENRSTDGIECPLCHGYAASANCTPEEVASDANCGRSYECCVAAFVCKVCGKRLLGNLPAPEMD